MLNSMISFLQPWKRIQSRIISRFYLHPPFLLRNDNGFEFRDGKITNFNCDCSFSFLWKGVLNLTFPGLVYQRWWSNETAGFVWGEGGRGWVGFTAWVADDWPEAKLCVDNRHWQWGASFAFSLIFFPFFLFGFPSSPLPFLLFTEPSVE